MRCACPRFWCCALLAAGLLLLAAGCSPKTSPAKFYLLQALSRADAGVGQPSPPLVGVGPVEIPAYLDRPQIVTGGGGAQLHLDEFQRWAEPLRDSVTRVVAQNLSTLLPASQVLAFPWNRALAPDCQVEIQIGRLHVDEAGNSGLSANWILLKHNKPLRVKSFHAETAVAGSGREAEVAALSHNLAALSAAIAAELRVLAASP